MPSHGTTPNLQGQTDRAWKPFYKMCVCADQSLSEEVVRGETWKSVQTHTHTPTFSGKP